MERLVKEYLNPNPDRFYLKLAISFFVVWIFMTGPLRWLVRDSEFATSWFTDVAPNFFAGIALVFWQRYGTGTKPVMSFLCAVSVLGVVEIIQLLMSAHRADWNDVFASIVGASLASLAIYFRSKHVDKPQKA
jgi:hypothetical protein